MNKQTLFFIGLSGLLILSSGCTSVLPIGTDTPIATTTTPTASPDSNTDENLVYTSDDSAMTITLPDETWVNTADSDSRRTFLSDETGILGISHYTGDYADSVTLPQNEYLLTTLLMTKPSVATFSEGSYTYQPSSIINFTYEPQSISTSYYYELSYTEGTPVQYEIVSGMQAPGEVIEIVGKLYTSDATQIEKLRASIASVRFLDGNYDGILRTTGTYAGDHAGSTSGTAIQYKCIQSANVRSAAGMSGSTVLGELAVGDVIDLIAEVNGWLEFEFQGQTAYVYGDYMQLVTEPAAATVTPSGTASGTKATPSTTGHGE